MSRIIGCQQLHLAEVLTDTLEGATFGVPEIVPSVISVEIADNSENVTFYSDDVVEQVIPAFSGKEVTIELGYLDHKTESKISGNKFENGAFVQNANATAKEYALLFRAPLSRGGFQYVCLYKGVLSRTESTYKTKEDSIEGQTVTLSGVFMPLVYNGNVAIKANSTDEGAETLTSKWFTKVPMLGQESEEEPGVGASLKARK